MTNYTEPVSSFIHEALFYASDKEYLAHTVDFIEEGLEAGEPVLIAVPGAKLDLLRPRLDRWAPDQVRFAAMEDVGRNPAWIIPRWSDFARPYADAGKPARGIGEPIWSTRSPDELVECGRHEALINLAFADVNGFRLLCPYDLSSLDDATVEESRRNHPHVSRAGVTTSSHEYESAIPPWLETPLPPAPADAQIFEFDHGSFRPIREAATRLATAIGISAERIDDLLVAVTEAIANSLRHGGGSGRIALWTDHSTFRCEVRDAGRISDPMAGRIRPPLRGSSGRGLWLMNQLCDLVQIRVLPEGQAIRLHMVSDANPGRAA